MCDPLTIAGLALTAGSTVANTVANNRAAGARSEVLALERDRQNRLDSEAAAANVAARDRRLTPTQRRGRSCRPPPTTS